MSYESSPQGTHALSYQWYYSSTVDGEYEAIAGANDESFTTDAAGFYFVEVTANGMVTGTVESDPSESSVV